MLVIVLYYLLITHEMNPDQLKKTSYSVMRYHIDLKFRLERIKIFVSIVFYIGHIIHLFYWINFD